LVFALKYEGVDLAVLNALFQKPLTQSKGKPLRITG
jgi:uncharacterized protein YjhX (UPF0386 family)